MATSAARRLLRSTPCAAAVARGVSGAALAGRSHHLLAGGRKRQLAAVGTGAVRSSSSNSHGAHQDSNDDDDVRLVAAAADGGLVIGKGGQLPWDLPEDRRHFFHLTRDHILVLGRRSYEESGHALPGRTTIVVSRTLGSLPDAHVTPSLPDALALARKLKSEARSGGSSTITWIGGGHDLYAEAMAMRPGAPSRCRLLYLTRVHMQDVQGDAFFPSGWPAHFPRLLWSCPSRRHPCTYEIYARVLFGRGSSSSNH